MYSYIVADCVEMIGIASALNTYGVEVVCDPATRFLCNAGVCVPDTGPCGTTSVFGNGHNMPGSETTCYLPVIIDDPYYDFMWDHEIIVDDITVHTAKKTDAIPLTAMPYLFRQELSDNACPDWVLDLGWCTRPNVCTEEDELAELCTMD